VVTFLHPAFAPFNFNPVVKKVQGIHISFAHAKADRLLHELFIVGLQQLRGSSGHMGRQRLGGNHGMNASVAHLLDGGRFIIKQPQFCQRKVLFSGKRSRRAKPGGKINLRAVKITQTKTPGHLDICQQTLTGEIIGVQTVNEIDDLVCITSQGNTIKINVAQISIQGKNTQGITVVNLKKPDVVVSVARVINDKEDEPDASVSE